MIYWFTGQPSHGKTVLADKLKKFIIDHGTPEDQVFRIDGDEMRDLFTNKDYSMNGRINGNEILLGNDVDLMDLVNKK